MNKLIIWFFLSIFSSICLASSPLRDSIIFQYDNFRLSQGNYYDLLGTRLNLTGSFTEGKSQLFDGNLTSYDNGASLLNTQPFTIFAVINASSLGEASLGKIVDNGKVWLGLSATNKITFSSNYSTVASSSDNSISFGAIQVICVTRAADGTANIFINGTASGSFNQASGTPVNATNQEYIGNRANGQRGFDGRIYHVSFFNKILTPQEIRHQTEVLKRWYQAENR